MSQHWHASAFELPSNTRKILWIPNEASGAGEHQDPGWGGS